MRWPVPQAAARALSGRLLAIAVLVFCSPGEGILARAPEGEGPASSVDSELILTLGAGATSNAEIVRGGEAPGGDYMTDLGLDFSTTRRTERTDWSFRYHPFYNRYEQRGELNTLNHSLDFRGGYDLSRRARLILSDSFGYSRNPLYVARYEEGQSPVLTQESKRWSNTSSAGVDLGLSRSLTLQVGVTGTAHRFQEADLYDSENYSGSAGFSKNVGRDGSLSVSYLYSRFLLSAPNLPDLETRSHGLRAGWAHAMGEASKTGVSLGLTRLSGEAGLRTFYTGDAFFRRSLRRGDVSAGYRQELSADSGFAAVNLARTVYAGFSRRAGRLGQWGLLGDYGTRESTVVAGDEFDNGSLVDLKYFDVVARGEFALGPRWGVSGSAMSRRQEDAGDPGGAITVNSIFLGMTFRIF